MPVTPRIPLRGNKSSHRSTLQHQHTRQQHQRHSTPNTEQQKTASPPAQPESRQSVTFQSQQPLVTTHRTTTLTPTTYEETTLPITQMPLKTGFPDNQFGEVTTIPQSSHDKVMPGDNLDSEPAVHNNEIFQSGPISPLQLLSPPTQDFSSSFPSSSSSIPLQAEASTNFTVRRPISRKETFSWALLDEQSN